MKYVLVLCFFFFVLGSCNRLDFNEDISLAYNYYDNMYPTDDNTRRYEIEVPSGFSAIEKVAVYSKIEKISFKTTIISSTEFDVDISTNGAAPGRYPLEFALIFKNGRSQLISTDLNIQPFSMFQLIDYKRVHDTAWDGKAGLSSFTNGAYNASVAQMMTGNKTKYVMYLFGQMTGRSFNAVGNLDTLSGDIILDTVDLGSARIAGAGKFVPIKSMKPQTGYAYYKYFLLQDNVVLKEYTCRYYY